MAPLDNNRRRSIALLAAGVLLIAVMAAILLLAGGGGSSEPDRYVALGDSFSAGMGLEPLATDTVPRACMQSIRSYAYLVQAAERFSSFESTTCSGAVIPDLYKAQPLEHDQSNRAQLDQLTGDESFVTLSIGGNDVGFWGTVLKCFSNDNPAATPCRDTYLVDGKDLLREKADKLKPYLQSVIDEVRKRSPEARVYLVGYAQIVNAKGDGCLKPMRASAPDAAYFDGFERYLNGVMRDAAKSRGVRFIDIYVKSIGHDACKPPATRWIEPRVGSRLTPNIQVHPNEAGERAAADLILAALKADGT